MQDRSRPWFCVSHGMTVDTLAGKVPASVFLTAVTYSEERSRDWRGWLSEEERSCIASFGAEKRRREFVAGRAAARRLLADRLDTQPEEVPLRRAKDDAVDVEGTDWQVSIAHSGPHAIAACARHRVGVDLEHIQPRDPDVARFLFAPEDRVLVEELPYDSSTALILCWALKEAVLKARRTGFRTSPKDIHLSVQPEKNKAVAAIENEPQWGISFEKLSGYWGTVASPQR